MLGGTSVAGLARQSQALRSATRRLLPGRARLAGGDAGGGRLPRPPNASRRSSPSRCSAPGGVFPPPPGYLQGLRKLCDECGALADLRRGDHRVRPAWIMVRRPSLRRDARRHQRFAKAITSGYLPLGGVVVGPRLRGWLEADDDYLLTHGGDVRGSPPAAALPGSPTSRSCAPRTCPSGRAPRRAVAWRAGLDRLADRPGVAGDPRRGPDAGGRIAGAAHRPERWSSALLTRRDHLPGPSLRELDRLLAAADHQRRARSTRSWRRSTLRWPTVAAVV